MTYGRTGLRVAMAALLVTGLGAPGCSRSPEEYLASGDAYFAKRQFDEAIIEYGNAVKARPDWGQAHYKLAEAYGASGDPVTAYGEYARASDMDPANIDAHMKAGTILLVAGEFDSARLRAEMALRANPNYAPALILLGNASAGLRDTARALQEIEQAINLDPSYAPAWTALGAARFLDGRRATAGDAFQKAVALAPKSVDARLALANFQWASGDAASAEKTLRGALAIDPASASAHRGLALLYLTTQRAVEAEPHFKALTGQPGGKLALADYYIGTGRTEFARSVLHDVEKTGSKTDISAARLRMASLAYAVNRRAEAHEIVDKIVAEHPRYAEGRIAKARMLLSERGRAGEAIAEAREAVKADATSPAAQYTLGIAELTQGRLDEAETAFNEVLRLSPRAAAAKLQLARVQLARGNSGAALQIAEDVARQRPSDPDAAVVLARSLRGQGDLPRAERELASRLIRQPDAVPLHIERGWVALQRQDRSAARSAFTEALRRAPDSFDARSGLITVQVADRKFDAAEAQIADWRRSSPNDGRLRLLGARVHIARGKTAEAERVLSDLVTSEPSQYEAYELLAGIYMSQGRIGDAIQQYDVLAERRPASAAGARTMIGLLHDAKGERDLARRAYEQVIHANPRAGVACNNLAWIYAEEGRLDEALRLATVAQEELRRRPEAEDTLGWVYLKKGLASHAVGAFERARERAPENPVYHYHLGLAYLKTGDTDRAKSALQRAIALGKPFTGAGDARAQLATLETGPQPSR